MSAVFCVPLLRQMIVSKYHNVSSNVAMVALLQYCQEQLFDVVRSTWDKTVAASTH